MAVVIASAARFDCATDGGRGTYGRPHIHALLLSSGPVRRLYFRFRRWIEGALGAFFVFAGYTLATSR
jgi:hypothetical protein